MKNHGLEGADMPTMDTFDISVLDEYDNDRHALQMLNEDGADESGCEINSGVRDNEIELLSSKIEPIPMEAVDDFQRSADRLLDVSTLNGESDLVDGTIIDEHMLDGNGFDKNLVAKGMIFGHKELVVHACQRYSILNRVEYQTYKSDKDRLILICRAAKEKCAWHVRAVRKKKAALWEITRYGGSHTCETHIVPKENIHLNKDFIALEIKGLFQTNYKLSPKGIKQIMIEKFGYEIPYLKAWKAREKALKLLFGDCHESFMQPRNEQPCDDQRCIEEPCVNQQCNNQQCNEQPCNEQPSVDRQFYEHPHHEQPHHEQPCDDQQCNDQPCNDQSCSRQPCDEQSIANEHEHSSYARFLVRSGQTAAEIFLNDPTPRTRKLASDLFHASLAELAGLGKESALNIDPSLIQHSREPSGPAKGGMPAKHPASDILHGTRPAEDDSQVDSSFVKSKRPKRTHNQTSL